MNGSKTYIATALAFVAALAVYAQTVVASGFDFNTFLQFAQSGAVIGALAALRHAIAKK